jgi:4-alpha-glucanotransferase
VLEAMSIDARTEGAARHALAELERRKKARLLAVTRVMPESDARSVNLQLPAGRGGSVRWQIEVTEEAGRVTLVEGSGGRGRDGGVSARLPVRLAPGYHRIRASLSVGSTERVGEQRLIVVPPTCHQVAEALKERSAFGVIANLYAVRSARNWGAGDLSDLAALAAWVGHMGGAFVGLNPLHALRNRGWGVSPYSPVSRLFRNVLYLDVTAIPEFAESATARALSSTSEGRSALSRLRHADRVPYETVTALKWRVVRELFPAFAERHAGGQSKRGRAYHAYLESQGSALEDFATFLALEQHFAAAGRASWREWPPAYRHPRSAAVAAFRSEHRDAVRMHTFVQFELDRQLVAAARRGRQAGLAIGLYQDLAVGTDRTGSDPWAFPGLFAEGASVGAPPDDYAAGGQDWGLPPADPARLAADGLDYWTRLLRSAFAHSGALRIDHAMGLVRQFWIPRGRSATEGCYVRYPAADLLGVLALESRRHRAVVIGEDLGTVPPGFASVLARWGILSSRVLYFERDGQGAFRPPSRYSARALVTATTHDHPPLAGFRHGRDLVLRRTAGQIADDTELERARAARAATVTALERALRRAGSLGSSPSHTTDGEFVAAVHAFLSRTPAPLVGVYLDDLMGETEPVNLPEVAPDRYPIWSQRPRLTLERLRRDAGVARTLEGLRSRGALGGDGRTLPA